MRPYGRPGRRPGELPPVWQGRRENELFAGRDDELERIWAGLARHRRWVLVPPDNLSDIGETELAVEYQHRYKLRYDLAWWVDCAPGSSIPDQLTELYTRARARLGDTAGPEEPAGIGDTSDTGDTSGTGEAGEAAPPASTEGWLIIFAGVDRPDDVAAYLPPGGAHVLIVADRTVESWRDRTMVIGPLRRQESVMLLTSAAPMVDPSTAARLGELVGHRPALLAEIAGYLVREAVVTPELCRRLLEMVAPGPVGSTPAVADPAGVDPAGARAAAVQAAAAAGVSGGPDGPVPAEAASATGRTTGWTTGRTQPPPGGRPRPGQRRPGGGSADRPAIGPAGTGPVDTPSDAPVDAAAVALAAASGEGARVVATAPARPGPPTGDGGAVTPAMGADRAGPGPRVVARSQPPTPRDVDDLVAALMKVEYISDLAGLDHWFDELTRALNRPVQLISPARVMRFTTLISTAVGEPDPGMLDVLLRTLEQVAPADDPGVAEFRELVVDLRTRWNGGSAQLTVPAQVPAHRSLSWPPLESTGPAALPPPGRGPAGASTYYFFTSHAHRDDRDLVAQFHRELELELRRKVSRRIRPAGFFDADRMGAGEHWPTALRDAVRTAPVLVALWCDDYFESDWCGREFGVFLERIRRATVPGESPPAGIIPVPWLLRESEVPAAAGELHVAHMELGRQYDNLPVLDLMRHRAAFAEYVSLLAYRVMDVAKDQLPPLDAEATELIRSPFRREA